MTARPVALLVRRGAGREAVKSYSYARATRQLVVRYELVRRRLATLDWLAREVDRWGDDVPDPAYDRAEVRGEVEALRSRLLAERSTLADEHARLDLDPDDSSMELSPRRAARNARRLGFIGLFDIAEVDGEWRALPIFLDSPR